MGTRRSAPWTILQKDGPDHLGLWCNAAPCASNGPDRLAITLEKVGRGTFKRNWTVGAFEEYLHHGESWPTAAVPMDSPCCSCKLTRALPPLAGKTEQLGRGHTDALSTGTDRVLLPPEGVWELQSLWRIPTAAVS